MIYKEMFEKALAQPNKLCTPAYFYFEKILKDSVKKISSAFGEKIELCYSIKANPFLTSYVGDGIKIFEVCSYGEYQICKNQLSLESEIIFGGVCKFDYEISEAIKDERVIVTAESLNQLEIINRLSAEKKGSAKILLRLSAGNQFGLSKEDMKRVIKNRGSYDNVRMMGIQFYAGTQTFKIEDELKKVNDLFDMISQIEKENAFRFEIVDFGAGIGVPYYKADYDKDNFEQMLRELSELILKRRNNHRVICEMGRAIAAECGIYLSRVIDQKENAGRKYSILDGGTNHIKYYGQAFGGRNVVIDILNDAEETDVYTICGPLCTVNDILLNNEILKKHTIGDVFLFPNAGAYCQTEANALFLSRELPIVNMVRADGNIVTLREETCTYILNSEIKNAKEGLQLRKEIYFTIKDIVTNLMDEEYEIKVESSFADDLEFDSVNLLYLQVAVEDEFDIRFDPISDDFSEIFKDVKSLCAYIEKKLGDS